MQTTPPEIINLQSSTTNGYPTLPLSDAARSYVDRGRLDGFFIGSSCPITTATLARAHAIAIEEKCHATGIIHLVKALREVEDRSEPANPPPLPPACHALLEVIMADTHGAHTHLDRALQFLRDHSQTLATHNINVALLVTDLHKIKTSLAVTHGTLEHHHQKTRT